MDQMERELDGGKKGQDMVIWQPKLYLFLLCGYVISLFLPFNAITHLIGILLLFPWFMPKRYSHFFEHYTNSQKKGLLLLIFNFLIYAVGYIFSYNKLDAWGAVVVRLSFLLFPLAFLRVFPNANLYNKVLKVYSVTCFLAALLCVLYRGYFYMAGNLDTNLFFNDGLLEIIQKKSVIFSSYVSLGIFCSCYLFFAASTNKRQKLIYCLLTCTLFLFLFLIAVRIALLITLSIMVAGLILYLLQQRKYFATVASVFLLISSFIGLLHLFPQTKSRFTHITNLEINFKNRNGVNVFWAENSDQNWNGLNLRLAKWICALDVVKENPVFGIGTGDVKDEMVEAYKARDFYYAAEQRFDPHNLYLDITVGAGLVGLLIFAIPVFYSLRLFYKRQNWLALAFMFLFLVSSLTESTLRSRDAVVFYAFFWCFFLAVPSEGTNNYNKQKGSLN